MSEPFCLPTWHRANIRPAKACCSVLLFRESLESLSDIQMANVSTMEFSAVDYFGYLEPSLLLAQPVWKWVRK